MKAEKLANQAVKEEKKLAKIQEDFALASPEFAKFLKEQSAIQAKITKLWDEVKKALVEANYTDVLENDNFKVFISPVINLKVEDIEKVPAEYVEMVKTPKMDKIKKHFELYEKLPEGIIDATYFRLNKKIK